MTLTDTTTGSHAALNNEPVLSVRDLNVRFATENGTVHAVRGMDFDLFPGRVLGIVGESGSGKSVTSLAIMQLLSENARVDGSIKLDGRELVGLSDKQMCKYRGSDIAMVFQDPLASLTPVFSVGRQIMDAIKIHNPSKTKAQLRERAIELLDLVGIPAPQQRVDSFPHEFSGGMRQRVMIAIAMANNPRIIICDEPTTALDVTIQAQILDVLKVAQRETGAAIIFITHDLGVLAGIADEMLVMYAGRCVERGSTDDIYYHPRMPYTMGLLSSIPRVNRAEKTSLVPIEGTPPNLLSEPTGCPFAPRCPLASAECVEGEPVREEIFPGHEAACVKAKSLAEEGVDAREVFVAPPVPVGKFDELHRLDRRSMLSVEHIEKQFPLMAGSILKRRIGTVHAVDDVSFDIREGECLSVVGESGCGKSTTLLEIMEFEKKQPGTIVIDGNSNHERTKNVKALREARQIVFQDSMSAMDPRFTVFEVLAEPMRTNGWSAEKTRERVYELIKLVGLQIDHVNRFPGQFSGGQRQRIAIARALALNPKVVVLDEPVSALDVSIQAGVINLLAELRAKLGLSYLFVAHDLSVVRHISDRVAVMYLGRIVEYGDVDEIFDNPKHPYTRALLSAIPVPDPRIERTRERIILKGGLPSPTEERTGCAFTSRCPIFQMLDEGRREKCRTEVPELREDGRDRSHACFFPEESIALASA